MVKRLFSIAAVVAILVMPAAPTVSAMGNQACMDSSSQTLLSGNVFNSTTSIDGVFARIEPHLDPCDGDDSAGAADWIALTPTDFTGNMIVQVGIINCHGPWTVHTDVDPCWLHPNTFRYFYAFGGCTFLTGPYARDAGAATTATDQAFKVERSDTGFNMWFPNGNGYWVSKNDNSVSCFYGANLNAQYGFEKRDRGDSTGGSTTQSRIWDQQVNYVNSGTWLHLNWGSSSTNCQQVMSTAPHYSACLDRYDTQNGWD